MEQEPIPQNVLDHFKQVEINYKKTYRYRTKKFIRDSIKILQGRFLDEDLEICGGPFKNVQEMLDDMNENPLPASRLDYIRSIRYAYLDIRSWFLATFIKKHQKHKIHLDLTKSSWYDADVRMERAIIDLLIEFFEQENPTILPEENPQLGELRKIYWWLKARDWNEIPNEELTPKLIRIVELRGLLWT